MLEKVLLRMLAASPVSWVRARMVATAWKGAIDSMPLPFGTTAPACAWLPERIIAVHRCFRSLLSVCKEISECCIARTEPELGRLITEDSSSRRRANSDSAPAMLLMHEVLFSTFVFGDEVAARAYVLNLAAVSAAPSSDAEDGDQHDDDDEGDAEEQIDEEEVQEGSFFREIGTLTTIYNVADFQITQSDVTPHAIRIALTSDLSPPLSVAAVCAAVVDDDAKLLHVLVERGFVCGGPDVSAYVRAAELGRVELTEAVDPFGVASALYRTRRQARSAAGSYAVTRHEMKRPARIAILKAACEAAVCNGQVAWLRAHARTCATHMWPNLDAGGALDAKLRRFLMRVVLMLDAVAAVPFLQDLEQSPLDLLTRAVGADAEKIIHACAPIVAVDAPRKLVNTLLNMAETCRMRVSTGIPAAFDGSATVLALLRVALALPSTLVLLIDRVILVRGAVRTDFQPPICLATLAKLLVQMCATQRTVRAMRSSLKLLGSVLSSSTESDALYALVWQLVGTCRVPQLEALLRGWCLPACRQPFLPHSLCALGDRVRVVEPTHLRDGQVGTVARYVARVAPNSVHVRFDDGEEDEAFRFTNVRVVDGEYVHCHVRDWSSDLWGRVIDASVDGVTVLFSNGEHRKIDFMDIRAEAGASAGRDNELIHNFLIHFLGTAHALTPTHDVPLDTRYPCWWVCCMQTLLSEPCWSTGPLLGTYCLSGILDCAVEEELFEVATTLVDKLKIAVPDRTWSRALADFPDFVAHCVARQGMEVVSAEVSDPPRAR